MSVSVYDVRQNENLTSFITEPDNISAVQFWPLTVTLVLAYMLSDICRYVLLFLGYIRQRKVPQVIFND